MKTRLFQDRALKWNSWGFALPLAESFRQKQRGVFFATALLFGAFPGAFAVFGSEKISPLQPVLSTVVSSKEADTASLFAKPLSPPPAKASSRISSEIPQIQTANRDLKIRLQRHFKNRLFSLKALQEYLVENGFYLAEIVPSGKIFVIKQPVHVIFAFRGNSFFTERGILKNIKIDEGKTGPGLYDFMENEIRRLYREKGFLKVRIKKSLRRAKHKERVLFRVFEGPRIRLAGIAFKGGLSKPPSYYENFVRNNSGALIKKGFYNKKDLEKGGTRLIHHLKSEGRMTAKIYSERVSFRKDRAFVTVHLEEGPLVLIRDIQIRGAEEAVPVWEILSLMESKAQAPLKIEVLRRDFSALEELYKSRGYLKMKIANKDKAVSYRPGERYASLSLLIEEGPKLFVSSIHIKGLIHVRPSLVKNLLRFKEGEVLSSLKRERSIQALGATGLFSDISVHEELEGDLAHLTVLLKERRRRSWKGALGLNTQRGLTARLRSQISHNNLFGYGRSLSLGGNGALSRIDKRLFFEYELSGKYGEVFSAGKNWRGNVNLSESKKLFNYSKDEKSADFVKKTNIGFFLNRRVGKDFKIQWNIYSFENRREDCPNKRSCVVGPQRIAGSKFQFLWDGRDNIFDPAKGGLSSFSLETALPQLGSSPEIAFVKSDLQSRWYWPLFKKATFGLALKTGMIGAVRGKQYIPVSRAFILGGRDSVRGYDGRLKGSRIPGPSKAHIESANSALKVLSHKGASSENAHKSHYGLLNLEFRFPFLENVKGSFFYDVGGVWMKAKKSGTVFDFGHSLGLGFRYQVFLIPVGLDIAYRLKAVEGEKSRYDIHFSIGW